VVRYASVENVKKITLEYEAGELAFTHDFNQTSNF
jgi:hypothetical protein